jgi:hypothetical protein
MLLRRLIALFFAAAACTPLYNWPWVRQGELRLLIP